MRLPIFGFCEEDLYVFANVDDACKEIEPEDARASSWDLFDRDGQRLAIRIVDRPLWRWAVLTWPKVDSVELVETGEFDQSAMEASLRSALNAIARHNQLLKNRIELQGGADELAEQAMALYDRGEKREYH